MFLNILVAVDGSAHATRALDEAVDLARALNSRLTLISVASRTSWRFMAGPYTGLLPTQDDADKEAQVTLREAAARLDDMPVTTIVGQGAAAAAIIKHAAGGGHDLIVMGSRGRGGAAAALLGSVSHSVLNHSHVPVLIVHADDAATSRRGPMQFAPGPG